MPGAHTHGPTARTHDHAHRTIMTTRIRTITTHDRTTTGTITATRTPTRRAALHAGVHGRTIALEQEILAKNQALAERNRGWFEGREVLALNLMSSPGAGKTTLLERTIRALRDDDAHLRDGRRPGHDQRRRAHPRHRLRRWCRSTPAPAATSRPTCWRAALQQLKPPRGSLVLIENVGNLVCPALFDLGERAKVVVVSVTEGEDKPLKYPHMFRAAG